MNNKTLLFAYCILFICLHPRLALANNTVSDLCEKSRKFIPTNFDSANYYTQVALYLAQKNKNASQLAEALFYQSNVNLTFRKNLHQIDSLTLSAIELSKSVSDTNNLARLYNLRGNFFGFQHKSEKLIESYDQLLAIARAKGNKEMEYMALSGLGSYYFQTKQFAKANQMREQNLKVALEIGDPYKIAIEQSKYAYGLIEMGNLNLAKSELKKSHVLNTNLNHNALLIISNGELGEVYFKLNNIDSAFYFLNQAKNLVENGGSKKYYGHVLFWLAKAYMVKKDFKLALKLIEEGIQNCTQFSDNHLKMKFFKLKAEVYSQLNRGQEVFESFSNYVNLKDSFNNAESEKIRIQLQENFEANQREHKIAMLTKEKEINELTQKYFIAGFILLLVVSILIIRDLKRRNKQRKLAHELAIAEKEKLKVKIDYQNRELTSKALQIIQKNEYAKLVKNRLSSLTQKEQFKPEQLKDLKSLATQLEKTDKDWEYFNNFFIEVNPNFYTKLSQQYPEITPQELKQAALLKMNLSTKEAASVLNIAPQSVKMARHRLKKKINLSSEQDLGSFLRQIA